MHAYALDNDELFAFVSEYYQRDHGFEALTTHTGSTVLRSPATETEGPRAFFALGPDRETSRQTISWIYKNLHPATLSSVGFSEQCGPASEISLLVPTSCLRSAGHTEFGGNPVLFEELPFDPELQRQYSLRLGAKVGGHLFGSDRPLRRDAEFEWIWTNLHASSWDLFTAELLLAGKRFHCPIGCVKLFGAVDGTNRKKLLLEALEAISAAPIR